MHAWHSTSSVACSIPNRAASTPLSSVARSCRVVQAQRPAEHDVRRERGIFGAEGPHVQMVHRLHARLLLQRGAHLGHVDVGGYGLEQHPGRVAQQLPRAADHQHRDGQRRDRVEAVGAEHHRPDRGEDHRERAQRVEREMHERGPQVEVAVRGACQHERAPDVDHQPRAADHQHTRPRRRDAGGRGGAPLRTTTAIAPASNSTPLA